MFVSIDRAGNEIYEVFFPRIAPRLLDADHVTITMDESRIRYTPVKERKPGDPINFSPDLPRFRGHLIEEYMAAHPEKEKDYQSKGILRVVREAFTPDESRLALYTGGATNYRMYMPLGPFFGKLGYTIFPRDLMPADWAVDAAVVTKDNKLIITVKDPTLDTYANSTALVRGGARGEKEVSEIIEHGSKALFEDMRAKAAASLALPETAIEDVKLMAHVFNAKMFATLGGSYVTLRLNADEVLKDQEKVRKASRSADVKALPIEMGTLTKLVADHHRYNDGSNIYDDTVLGNFPASVEPLVLMLMKYHFKEDDSWVEKIPDLRRLPPPDIAKFLRQ